MDMMLREPLVKLQIEDRIRESEQRTRTVQACGGDLPRQPTSHRPLHLHWWVRRRLAALLIRAGRRLSAGARPTAQLSGRLA